MQDTIRFLKLERAIQKAKLDELYYKYGDTKPYHAKVEEQRNIYFYVCKLYREALASQL